MTTLTKERISAVINTPTVRTLVSAYLLTRANAEIMREKVDEIERQVLTDIPVYATPRSERRNRSDRLYLGKELYLTDDDELVKRVYAEFDKRERAADLKPVTMSDDHCPALVAEHELVKVEHRLLEQTCKPLGIKPNLYGENRTKWIDLVVGAILSLPDYAPPSLS